MTIDEAHLILNAKRGEGMERIIQVNIPHLSFRLCSWLTVTRSSQNYEHLSKANSPPTSTTPNPKPAGDTLDTHSTARPRRDDAACSITCKEQSGEQGFPVTCFLHDLIGLE